MFHRKSKPHAPKSAAFAALCALLLPAACDDKPEPPPKDSPSIKPVEVDLKHAARIKTDDRSFSLHNLVLVLQADMTGGRMMGVTLSTVRPEMDGSRMVFGTFERANTIVELAKAEVNLSGPAFLDANGSGIFTPAASYLPKSAILRITSYKKDEAEGTIRGDFYRHKAGQPTLHPPVVPIEATFSAKLIER